MPSPSSTSERASHPSKALASIVVTPSGITIFSSDTQSRNAYLPIAVRLSGSETSLSPSHPRNELFPIEVIPSSTTTLTTVSLCEYQATFAAVAKSVMSPLPLIVSTPLSSSTQLAAVPQLPLAVSALAMQVSINVQQKMHTSANR